MSCASDYLSRYLTGLISPHILVLRKVSMFLWLSGCRFGVRSVQDPPSHVRIPLPLELSTDEWDWPCDHL
jgi:hypothetical protein